jgi:CubicO group peptidase (beta-lactamase class C family)
MPFLLAPFVRFFVFSLLLFAVIFTASQKPYAHSGPMATAFPVSNITIDGDLSDWSQNLPVYPINHSNSITKENESEIKGQFQVGYDRSNNKIVVAIQIQDDEIITEPLPYLPLWNSQDSAEVIVDIKHSISQTQPAQFTYRDKYGVFPTNFLDGGNAVRAVKDGMIYYEFAVDVSHLNESTNPLPNGTVIGFDVIAVDCDSDAKNHVIQWGPVLEGKWQNSMQLADLIISDREFEYGSLSGSLTLSGDEKSEDQTYPPVYIQSADNSNLRIQASCKEDGTFSLRAPSGKYSVHIADSINIRVSDIPSKKIQIKTEKDTELGQITVHPIPKPNLIEETGILQQSKEIDQKKIATFVKTYMDYYMIPGASLAIIKDSKIAYSQTYGVKNAETKEPVTENTVFEAASMTKCLFAFAVNRLVERNILDLDTPLHSYLPNNPYTEDVWNDERYKQITAKHVLTHRTGFPNWRDSKLAIQFDPGSKFGYSGEGFEFLGSVVSHLTGDGLEEVIHDEVFQPLGIENASLIWNAVLAERKATAHTGGNIPHDSGKNSKPGMAWSLVTDPRNYAKFAIAILDRTALNSKYYDEMLRLQNEVMDAENESPFGLGIVVEETPFGKRYSHGGSNTGFRCFFEVYDDLDMGFVCMTNSDQGSELCEKLDALLISGNQNNEK